MVGMEQMNLVIVIVQIVGGVGMLVAIATSIWSLLLQKKEVTRQNGRIISLLESIDNKLNKK